MNHPKLEEWVPYVFGESNPETRRQLSAHLRDCPECRLELQSWKRSLSRLDRWKLTAAPGPALRLFPALNWAAAAALVVLLAFGIGRATAAKADAQHIRAAIEPQLRQQLKQEMSRLVQAEILRSASATLAAANQQTEQALAVLTKAIEETRSEDNRAMYNALSRLDSRVLAQLVSLKKDLETVAVNTDEGLRDTAQTLVQLADYRQAGPPGK